MTDKTHRMVKKPSISARFLADFMVASDIARRTIIRDCKYVSTARRLQHDRALPFVSGFIRHGKKDKSILDAKAKELRELFAADDFERRKLDINADFIQQFGEVFHKLGLEGFDRLPSGTCPAIEINGVRVRPDIRFKTRRITKTNKVRIGAAALRYSKGKPLKKEIGEQQSAFMHGYLALTSIDGSEIPEQKLCITIDAQSGAKYEAPSKAVTLFNNMKAACATIAERWDNIDPPENAVF